MECGEAKTRKAVAPKIKFDSLIPPLTDEEFGQLERSIIAEGCRDSLVTWNGILLDGHNRLKICEKHGLPYKTTALEFEDEAAAKVWMLKNQFGRRNLSPSQRCKLALLLKPLIQKKAKKRQRKGGEEKVKQNSAEAGQARDELAEVAGVSHDTIAKYEVIQENADQETLDKLDHSETTINKVYKEVRRKQKKPAAKPTPLLPPGVYDVIYADPPWSYEGQTTSPNRTVEQQYPTMTLDDICRMELPIADNAVLFLWATAPKLEEALRVLNAWGFTYRTNAVWDKQRIGMGYWFRIQHELLLVGVRGKIPRPEPKHRVSSVMRHPRGRHSQKPQPVYDIIEQAFPGRKYLELFSRSKRDGWTMWGLDA